MLIASLWHLKLPALCLTANVYHTTCPNMLRELYLNSYPFLLDKVRHLGNIPSIPCQSRRISAVKVVMENNFSYVLLSVYLPSDNFCNILNQLYAAEINVMEHIFNTVYCNAFMICSDFNTSFSRDNAQTTHLSDLCIEII